MIYDGSNSIVKIVNAERLSWQPGSFDVKPRNVSALAFRIQGAAGMYCAGNHYNIDAGDILYMPQGLGYQVEYTATEMIAFHFVTEQNDLHPEVYTLLNRSRVHQLFLKAADLWKNKNPGYVNFCTAILYEILGEICAENLQSQMPEHFKRAVDYIHQHFREDFKITDLCKSTGICPTAFRQLFRIHYGVTPTQYVRNLRLEYARNLIAGGASVEQAAQQCGIPDSKYFARLIKETYGCTPRQLHIYGK